MFKYPDFRDEISPITLRFKSPRVESYYQSLAAQDFIAGRPYLFPILGSSVLILGTTTYIAVNDYNNGLLKEALGGGIGDCLLLFGIVAELVINYTKCLQPARTVPLVLCNFLASALANTSKETSPTMRPGY